MFSYDDKIKAVKLLIQYDMSSSDVRNKLGYPSKKALRNWYQEYKKNGDLRPEYLQKSKYSLEEKLTAVTYYLKHGNSVSRTVRKLGYPSWPALDIWIIEIAPDQKKHCLSGGVVIKCSYEKKEKAVISLCTRYHSAEEVAIEHGITRANLYKWKHQLLKEESISTMDNNYKKTET